MSRRRKIPAAAAAVAAAAATDAAMRSRPLPPWPHSPAPRDDVLVPSFELKSLCTAAVVPSAWGVWHNREVSEKRRGPFTLAETDTGCDCSAHGYRSRRMHPKRSVHNGCVLQYPGTCLVWFKPARLWDLHPAELYS